MSLTLVGTEVGAGVGAAAGVDPVAAAHRPSYRPFAVEVVSVEDLSPTFRRLTMTGPDLHECGATLLDQRVKLVLTEPRPELLGNDGYAGWRTLPAHRRPAVRTYTLATVDRVAGTAAIDLACRPAHGPASRFAHDAVPGARFVVIAPDALCPDSAVDGIAWHPGAATDVLLVGDETAVPAIRNILRSLPAAATGRVVLDVPNKEDAVDLAPPADVSLDVLERDPRGVGVAAAEILHVAAPPVPAPWGRRGGGPLLWDESETPAEAATCAWFGGEAAWIASLRRASRQHGPAASARSFMGYWRQGRPSPA